MDLSGIQKLTLLDYPGKVACTLFTEGCNMRCPFCHNALLVTEKNDYRIPENDILNFLKQRQGILDGVVITGGEPLIHYDIKNLLIKIKDLSYKIKLDTNGTNPKLLKELVSENLVDRVAVDIKNSPEEYGKAVGIENFDIKNVEETKNFLLRGSIEYEFRTTVVKGIHTKESIISLAKFIEGASEYYMQQYKDSGNLINPAGLKAFDKEEMIELKELVKPYVPNVKLRGV